MLSLTILVGVTLAPVVILTGFFAVEVLMGLSRLPARVSEATPARAVVVIPAHDEQPVIAGTVAHLKKCCAGQGIAMLVVADNCVDDTAAAARAAGAEVLVRNDVERRGKGFALAAARSYLSRTPPDVVIVIDADCCLDGESVVLLARTAAISGRPCQAVNLLIPDLGAPVLVQISTFAFMIKNLVRQRGLQRLAGRAHLNGTGMALPWRVFEYADLGGANIVEDLALGVDLAQRGTPPMFVEGATVLSPPASASGTLVQRSRWEGGYLATAIRNAPRAFARSVRNRDVRGVCAAFDLAIPPLALLFVLNAAGCALALAATLLGAPEWLLIIQMMVGIMAATTLGLAWFREGRRFASGRALLQLPMYVLWKLPMYFGLARRGAPKEWLRTGR